MKDAYFRFKLFFSSLFFLLLFSAGDDAIIEHT